MPTRWFWSVALLAWATSARAEAPWTPPDCADLSADSLEAAILDCGDAAAPSTAEDLSEHQWEELQPPLGETVGADETPPERVVVNRGEAPAFGPPPAAVDRPTADRDGVLAAINPESVEPLDAARATAGGEAEGQSLATNELRVPNGQRPPPGLCRLWFPDRPAGFQRPPTPCDVEVPEGAVLIRG